MRQLKIQKAITNRDSRSLDQFLTEIGHEELLTAEQEVELAQRIKKGDQKALDKLVKCNLRFVVSVAKQYQNQGLSLEDIINEGNLGLIKAALKFDETKGFKFISYAVWWVRQTIALAIAEQSRVIRLPMNQVTTINKLNHAIHKFEQSNERRPSPEELAELSTIPENKIYEAIQAGGRHSSIDAPFGDGESSSLLDVIVNEDSPSADQVLVEESLHEEIDRALDCLPEREKYIINSLYGLDGGVEMTYEEVAKELGIGRERVRQLKDKIILKLKKHNSTKTLKTYLGK